MNKGFGKERAFMRLRYSALCVPILKNALKCHQSPAHWLHNPAAVREAFSLFGELLALPNRKNISQFLK